MDNDTQQVNQDARAVYETVDETPKETQPQQEPVTEQVQPQVTEQPAVDVTVGQPQQEVAQVPVQDAPVSAPVSVEQSAPVVTPEPVVAAEPAPVVQLVEEEAPATPPVIAPVEAPVTVQTPVVETPVEIPVVTPTPVNETPSGELSQQSQQVINGLHNYVEKMKNLYPSYLTLGGQYQHELYNHLVKVLHTGEQEFETVLSHTLQIIKDNLNGVFHDSRLSRYANQTKLSTDESNHMHHLLHGLVTLADPVTREAKKLVVDVEKMLPLHKVAEEARARVKSFFNI